MMTQTQSSSRPPENDKKTQEEKKGEDCPECDLLSLCASTLATALPRPVLKNKASLKYFLAKITQREVSEELGDALKSSLERSLATSKDELKTWEPSISRLEE